MTHDAIRTAIDRKAKEVTVPVSLASLMALIEERDSLERDLCMERELAQINRSADGFKTFEVTTVECTCTDPPTVYEVTTIERADGSIEGGWDMASGESRTEVAVVEPPAGDCSREAPALPDIKVSGFARLHAENLERELCGSRMPIGQVVESPAPVPVPKEKPFTADKGKGKPSEHVVPWRASYTPNQCRLALQIFAEGHHGVTVASQARVTKQTAHDIGKAYATQIEHMAGMGDKEREHFLDSLYRQMLARWVAAGNDPAIQPEAPLPNKTITEAAGTYKKGEKP
mgnify:FL=1